MGSCDTHKHPFTNARSYQRLPVDRRDQSRPCDRRGGGPLSRRSVRPAQPGTFRLPGLADRREDIEPNLDYELERFAQREGTRVTFNKEARERYLTFAMSPAAARAGNFRDLAASVTRMATLSPNARIDRDCVYAEIARLTRLWSTETPDDGLAGLLSEDQRAGIDPFDRVQLAEAIRVCRASRSLSEAGRTLFAVSRQARASTNDADRLRKYLARFGLDWAGVR